MHVRARVLTFIGDRNTTAGTWRHRAKSKEVKIGGPRLQNPMPNLATSRSNHYVRDLRVMKVASEVPHELREVRVLRYDC